MKRLLYVLVVCLFSVTARAADHELCSPDGNIVIKVSTGATVQWSVTFRNEMVLFPSGISITTKSDLYDYPNLFLFPQEGGKLEGKFPPAVLKSYVAPRTDRREVLAEKAPILPIQKAAEHSPGAC